VEGLANLKQTRSRGADKEKMFEKILDTGKNLFVREGSVGMRALARKLGMSQANLYNYVESKRELWIALRIKALKEFRKVMVDINKQKFESFITFCLRLAQSYLEFASEDYPRFQIWQLIPPPARAIDKITKKPKEIGPFERTYNPANLINQGIVLISRKAKEFNVNLENPERLLYYMYAVILGAAKAENDLKISQIALKKKVVDQIYEPTLISPDMLSPEDFRNHVLEELKYKLERVVNR
jgi:AcrR family transcriptional regulator